MEEVALPPLIPPPLSLATGTEGGHHLAQEFGDQLRLKNILFCRQGASVALRALCVVCVAMVLSWPCVGPCALVP